MAWYDQPPQLPTTIPPALLAAANPYQGEPPPQGLPTNAPVPSAPMAGQGAIPSMPAAEHYAKVSGLAGAGLSDYARVSGLSGATSGPSTMDHIGRMLGGAYGPQAQMMSKLDPGGYGAEMDKVPWWAKALGGVGSSGISYQGKNGRSFNIGNPGGGGGGMGGMSPMLMAMLAGQGGGDAGGGSVVMNGGSNAASNQSTTTDLSPDQARPVQAARYIEYDENGLPKIPGSTQMGGMGI